jgi:hypothetical protein
MLAGGVTLEARQDDIPRMPDGRPDLSGAWQALNAAHWDLEPHAADYGPIDTLGAQFAIPPGLGVVEGGEIPYLSAGRAQKEINFENRLELDPEVRCYRGGIPRSTYMPYPFQIVQNPETTVMVYQYTGALRQIFMGGTREAPIDTWMGWSNGRWEGDTLVVEVTGQVGYPNVELTGDVGLTWLDRAGNYGTPAMRVVERYTPMGPNHIQYEATVEDPNVFSEPWTIRMPLYRRMEPDFRLLEYKCVPFSEEVIYGHLRRQPPGEPEN